MTSPLPDLLAAAGVVPDGWQAALDCTPRRAFIPKTIWLPDPDGFLVPVRHGEEAWTRRVESDVAIATQVDDGSPAAPGGRGRTATSSASQPSLVLRMLRALDAAEGHRVLEIGTGTGWNAGLLTARLGAESVTSVEIDPAIAQEARRNLEGTGARPHLICGDGAEGAPASAPFDRIISTAAVGRIPRAWIEQTRPGGLIVTPWGSPYASTGLLRLQVGADGTAAGRVLDRAGFMWVRDQRAPLGGWGSYVDTRIPTETSKTTLPPEDLLDFGAPARFAVGLIVPHLFQIDRHDPAGSGEYTLWLYDTQGSWASVDHVPGTTSSPIEQAGPRHLWHEVETAHHWWTTAGRPGRNRFGLTVTPEDRHLLWVDEPGRAVPSWA